MLAIKRAMLHHPSFQCGCLHHERARRIKLEVWPTPKGPLGWFFPMKRTRLIWRSGFEDAFRYASSAASKGDASRMAAQPRPRV
jgi:hypothetical protein